MDKYSHATYGSAGLVAFFAGLSLYEWGFLIGVFASVALGIMTYLLNRREQMKRTRILQNILESLKTEPASESARIVNELVQKAPGEL
ncbi:phage holin family protein [Photorhabdus sp. APURE]|uniref:hypothetical protein n=1 Tax=Photorhabdus aballayi TaxID=2991723 RepID=UPI00223E3DE2|nr:hypothetical protein [Photorhabdus aballayi]MCW7550918.1 phage holin family protein [Photorhabdus aballayi]